MKSRRIRNRKQKSKKSKRVTRKQKGGYTQEQDATLNNIGFTANQIHLLENTLGFTYQQVMDKVNEVQLRPHTELSIEDTVVSELENEVNLNQTIPHEMNDDHDMDVDNDFLNLSDLNVSERFSGNTSYEDDSQMNGGKNRKLDKRRHNNKRTNKKQKINKGRYNKGRYNKGQHNKRRTNKKYYGRGGKGMTDTEDIDPIGYKEDEYDQLKNALNY